VKQRQPAAAVAVLLALLLAACSGTPTKSPPPQESKPAPAAASSKPAASSAGRRSPYAPAQEDLSKRGDYVAGGLYAPHIDDSAPDDLPDVDAIPEPEVRAEPRSRYGNRSYSVLGKHYDVLAATDGYVEQGLASYYGKKFHGRRTSMLEVYDMYAFSAAHKTLPLPSYARVTNLANGKSVVVRVNDRGPFHSGRIIDLSYAAAVKLGVHRAGVAKVEVRALRADEGVYGATTTGKTQPASVVVQSPLPPSASPPSALDRIVAALPIASANAGEHPPAAATAVPANEAKPAPGGPWRFDMRQDGKTMTADEFEAWMKARQVQVATGKPTAGGAQPGIAKASTPSRPASATAATAPPPIAAASAPPPRPIAAAVVPHAVAPTVTLQIAAFAARDNAERALAMLQDAGIGNARLLDAVAAGQKVWRLRIGPVEDATVAELSSRVRGLGFGPPNIVRE
jgi:rare lipoprotein A